MSDDHPPLAEVAAASDVTFSVRGLLIVMIPVALAAAVLGPYFRSVSPDERGRVMFTWALAVAVALAQLVRYSFSRVKLEKMAGQRVASLPRRGTFFFTRTGPNGIFFGGAMLVAVGLFYLVLTATDIATSRRSAGSYPGYVILPLMCGTLIAQGIVTMWWRRTVQFRENGALCGLQFLPWSHVTDRRWEGNKMILEGVNLGQVDTRFIVAVRASEMPAVDNLLSEKLPARLRQRSSRLLSAPPEIRLPKVEISPQQNIGLSNVAAILAVYAAIFIMAISNLWGRPPTAFYVGMGTGFFIAIIVSSYPTGGAGKAGPLLVRLSPQFNWRSIAGWLASGVMCYYTTQFVDTFPLCAGILGAGCGLAFYKLFAELPRNKLDLCENGVTLAQWVFFPWSRVELSEWHPHGSSKLKLRCGWRRITASVSNAQREAVDTIIREKLHAMESEPTASND